MTELCKFYKNGNIIYKNVNLIDLASTSIFIDITNSEIINSKDVYINKSTNTYYHKFQYGSSYTFLEWKQSKDSNWEWYKSDIIIGDLISLDNYLENPIDNGEKDIDIKELKNEIYENLYIIINKYNLNTIQSTYILDKLTDIEDIINLK
jgi:hypothetical protein